MQRILDAHGSPIKIISKIENQEGLDHIDEIIESSYGIMVARGDLGVELPAEAIPNTQRRIVEKCIAAKRPVIIATQMLYSMVHSPRPTRAEVSDVASAIYERVDAVMLSDETATGDYPTEAVQTMARVAREIERDENHFRPMIDMNMVSVNHEITAQLARSAVRASTNLPIRYVVLDTKTGRTGRYLAAFRGRKTVVAICYTLHAQRILALSYGVVAILRQRGTDNRYHFLADALDFLDQYGQLSEEDLFAIVGGSFGEDGGASYVEIAPVKAIRQRNARSQRAKSSETVRILLNRSETELRNRSHETRSNGLYPPRRIARQGGSWRGVEYGRESGHGVDADGRQSHYFASVDPRGFGFDGHSDGCGGCGAGDRR